MRPQNICNSKNLLPTTMQFMETKPSNENYFVETLIFKQDLVKPEPQNKDVKTRTY